MFVLARRPLRRFVVSARAINALTFALSTRANSTSKVEAQLVAARQTVGRIVGKFLARVPVPQTEAKSITVNTV